MYDWVEVLIKIIAFFLGNPVFGAYFSSQPLHTISAVGDLTDTHPFPCINPQVLPRIEGINTFNFIINSRTTMYIF